MSLVTEHLEQQGAAFEVLVHRQAYTSVEEARALGVDADEVLKTLAVRTGPGNVLAVIPAARRLDLRLVREAVGDHHARLATEDELGRDFPDYQLGALPPLGVLVGADLYVDPEVLGHATVCLRPAPRPSRSRCGPRSCLRREGSPPWRWSSGPSEAATTRSRRQVGPRRRRSITTR